MPDEIPRTYAAVFNIKLGTNDVHLVCGTPRIAAGDKGAEPVIGIDWAHAITMSPQTFKQLALLLQRTLPAYEEKIGRIEAVDVGNPELRASKPNLRRGGSPKKARKP